MSEFRTRLTVLKYTKTVDRHYLKLSLCFSSKTLGSDNLYHSMMRLPRFEPLIIIFDANLFSCFLTAFKLYRSINNNLINQFALFFKSEKGQTECMEVIETMIRNRKRNWIKFSSGIVSLWNSQSALEIVKRSVCKLEDGLFRRFGIHCGDHYILFDCGRLKWWPKEGNLVNLATDWHPRLTKLILRQCAFFTGQMCQLLLKSEFPTEQFLSQKKCQSMTLMQSKKKLPTVFAALKLWAFI